MKKLLIFVLSLLIGLSFSVYLTNTAIAAKKKNPTSQTLQAVNNEGTTEIDGSVLNPKVNEINIPLSKQLLAKIKTIGVGKLNVTLTATLDSTKAFSVVPDGLSIQRKAIKKVRGACLVVNLFNLTNASGVTISPSSLPNGNYKLTISGEGLNATTDSFLYRTPALIIGTVDSKTAGLVSVDSLQGEMLSEGTIATDSNGAFFTEVRANKINSTTKARRYLKAQIAEGDSATDINTNNNAVEEINVGVVNITAEKDLAAIVDLSNNNEINTQRANAPIVVNNETTLTAKLAIEGAKEGNEDLAVEAAKDQLNNLSSGENGPDDTSTSTNDDPGLSCNIDQFADRCSKDNTDFSLIGKDFKNFVHAATCNFPEFDLIKKIVLASNDDANGFIGKGYCEHATREEDRNKPCEIYTIILKNHQSGLESGLPPCPPPDCSQFKNITVDNPDPAKRCFGPKTFCEGTASPNGQCIPRPRKDLYCAKIGTDIKDSECKDEDFDQFKPGWKIETSDSDGAQYCIPSNFPKPAFPLPTGSFGLPAPTVAPPLPPSLKEIANQCPINTCHRDCDKKFPPQFYTPAAFPSPGTTDFQPPKCESCECHNSCEKQFGRFVDCNPNSEYFKKDQCCRAGQIVFSQTNFAYQSVPPPPSGFPQNYPIPPGGSQYVQPDVQGCLCSDPNNFDSKGYAKKDAQNACKDKCPNGFEKDPNNLNICVHSCPEGTIRGPKGDCRKKCPEGLTQDEFGGCKCPEGKSFNYTSGKCETSSSCPEYCKNYSLPTFTATLPLECQKCLNGGPSTCSGNMQPNPNNNGEAQCVCPPGLPYWSINQCVASCPNGTPSPGASNNLPPKSPIPCGSYQTSCPAPYVQNPSGMPPCKCPDATPYNLNTSTGSTCVASCPAGLTGDYPSNTSPATSMRSCLCPDKSYPNSNNQCSTTNYCSPGISTTTGCTCGPGAIVSDGGVCKCTSPTQTYTKENGCSASQISCPAPYIKDPAFPNQCTCPSGTPYELGTTCVATCPSNLVPSTAPGGNSSTRQVCKCQDGTYPNGNGTCSSSCTGATPIKCSDGTCAATQASCSSYCPAPYVQNPSGTPPCKCPEATPYNLNTSTGSTCVATCPSGLIGDYPSNTSSATSMRFCLCPDKSYPNSNNQCSTSQCPASTPVKCSDGTCATTQAACPSQCPASTPIKCPNGTCVTSSTACTSTQSCPAPYVTNPAYNSSNPGGVPPCKCPEGKYSYNNSCVTTCPASLVTGTPASGPVGAIPSCLCSGTLQYPGANGQCSTTCTGGQIFDPAINTCRCPNNQVLTNGNCQCPSGYIIDPNSSSNCILQPQTIGLTSASITGNNLTLSYTKSNFNECVLVVGSNGNILHNGVSSYGLLCSPSGGTATNSLGSFLNVSPGSQIKLCKGNGTDANTNTNLLTPNLCSSPITVTTSDTITLSNVVKETSGDLTVTYNKNFSDCVGLRQNDINGLRVTGQNQFCANSGTQTVSAANLMSSVQAGTQVVLCNDVSGLCSTPIAITAAAPAAPRITLSSAALNNGVITFNFTKDNGDCFKLYTSDGTLLEVPNHCFGGASGIGYPTNTLNTTLAPGTQVKACYSLEPNVCSQSVSVTGQ